jgi:hypothetical protein
MHAVEGRLVELRTGDDRLNGECIPADVDIQGAPACMLTLRVPMSFRPDITFGPSRPYETAGVWTQLDQKDALTLVNLFGSPATPSVAARPVCFYFLYALVEVRPFPTARIPSEQPCGHFLVLFFLAANATPQPLPEAGAT